MEQVNPREDADFEVCLKNRNNRSFREGLSAAQARPPAPSHQESCTNVLQCRRAKSHAVLTAQFSPKVRRLRIWIPFLFQLVHRRVVLGLLSRFKLAWKWNFRRASADLLHTLMHGEHVSVMSHFAPLASTAHLSSTGKVENSVRHLRLFFVATAVNACMW